MRTLDITGRVFGRLTALEPSGRKKKQGIIWKCICCCPNKTIIYCVCSHLMRGNIKSCGCAIHERRSIDITGKTFGKLTVLEMTNQIKNGRFLWKCECNCVDRNILYLECKRLTSGNTASCGCIKKEKIRDKHFAWKGCGEISSSFFKRIISPHKNRKNREISITIEYVWELFLKQDRKCSLTGLELKFSKTTTRKNNGETDCTASLDRIDSNQGYIIGNVQWVHKWVNIMKQDMNDKEFIDWCKLVVCHSNNKLGV